MRKEGSITELLQRVEKIASEGKEATAKATCQVDLDHEAAVQCPIRPEGGARAALG